MRITGYLLVVLGLIATPYLHYARLHGAKGRAAAFALQSSPEGNTYDVSEVGQTVRRALDEMGRNMPSIPPPALVIVAGAVLLDIAGRRRRRVQNA
jgi:hypothetical protein